MKRTVGILIFLCALTFSAASVVFAAFFGNEAGGTLGWKFEYDDGDRVTKVTDPAGRDTRVQYSFDDAKRLRKSVRTRADGSSVTIEFDQEGRRSSMTDGAGIVSYGYDNLGRLNRVQRRGAAAIAYTYDTLDRVTSLRVGDFYRVDYVYDFLGRLESMKTPVGVIQYEYLTGQGQVIRTLPNGVKTFWKRQPNGELEEITHGFFRKPDDKTYVVLAQYVYEHGPDGRIAAIRERSGQTELARHYAYDKMGRLTRATGPGNREYRYEYDLIGNRTRALATGQPDQVSTCDWAGRLTSVEGKPSRYDATGNLMEVTLGGVTRQYRYNSDGRLAEAKVGRETVQYRYDGSGHLVARKTVAGETRFIPDPLSPYWQPFVGEEPGGVRTLVIWDGAIPLALVRNGKVEWLLHDHLGSVRLEVDGQGKVTRRIDYDPFGVIADSTTAGEFAPRFAGMFWDPNAQIQQSLARAYTPGLARFLEFEPKPRLSDGLHNEYHPFAYCGNDPINWLDSDGSERFPTNPATIDIATDWVPPGISFHDKTVNYVDRWASLIPEGGKLAIVFLGINNRWDDAVEETRKNFKVGNYTIVVPTYAGWSRRADWLRTANDHFRTAAPIGAPMISISLIPIQFHTRKVGVPELLSHLEGHCKERGIRVSALVFESGANFLLQENIGALVSYARSHSDLPDIGVLSGSISEPAHQKALEEARYRVTSLGEYGEGSVQKLVPALERRFADFAPFRIAPLGLPGYLINVGKTVFKYAPEHTMLSDKVGSQNIPVELADSIETKERGHGYKARKDLTDSYIGATRQSPRPLNALAGVSLVASSVPLNAGELLGLEGRSRARGQGGFGLRGGGEAWGGHREGGGTSLSPSSVGGVYLGRASAALDGIGTLKGVRTDGNGNLVLFGQTSGEIKLPPLRLDDVVTVFRSVYLHGEGPTVTIDPNPENPEGSAMIIRHGKATENTYVGWVLYEADRLMKGYTLGVDNKSTQQLISSVPGYLEVLNTIYFGGESPEKRRKEGHWERFWIVPAEARRFDGKRKELTLFDVPLKVKTQKMKWQKGNLVDDLQGKSSPGALAFTDWFTTRYDLIAGEQFLTPPRESGITHPVPVFTELRRIALITAIAEKLRDQGVPLPFWMRDYEVQPVPFEKYTPGLEVTRSNQRVIARIYGGVELSPSDKDVRTFTTATDLSKLPKAEQASVREKTNLAGALEETIRTQVPAVEPLRVRQFTHQGEEYRAVAVPGAETQSLAPCRLEEADLTAPVEGGDGIRLVRSYNSFFSPTGPLGKGWTMDLPRLEEFKVPVKRDGKTVQYQTGSELITPLNSLYTRFFRIEEVAALNRSRMQVPDQSCEFFGLTDGKPDFLSGPTRQLIRKDDGIWHFSRSGSLVATEQGGYRTVYERDEKDRLTRIVGLQGRRPVASIELRYDAAGRLQEARTGSAGRESTVRYEYDHDNRLTGVVSESGRVGYRYDGSRLTAITFRAAERDGKKANEITVRLFEYNSRGQLLAEVDADGARTEYRVTADAKGTAITMSQPGSNNTADSMRYDQAFRPIEAKYADGTRASWNYPAGGGMVLDVVESDGSTVRFRESADKRRRTLELDKQNQITGEYDTAGRLTALAQNGQPLLSQEWTPDGRLRTVRNETSAAHLEFGTDGLTSRIIVAPPGEQGQFKHWQETKLDAAGRPVEVSDYSGMRTAMSYDASGDLAEMTSQQNGKSYGLKVSRDKSGRIQDIQSSWGKQHCSYDTAGLPTKVEMEKGGQKASAEWKSGLLQKVTQFDGGSYSVIYNEGGKQDGLPKQITTPNRLTLTYNYDESSPREVDIGKIYKLNYEFDNQRRLKSLSMSPAK